MVEEIILGDIRAEVIKKDIKNVHLSVHPPNGRVRIAAPQRMDLETIRIFTISKLAWIKKQQQRFENQQREPQREYLNRESHYFLGTRYLLRVRETEGPTGIVHKVHKLELHVRRSSTTENRKKMLDEWYRAELKSLAADLIDKWEARMKVSVSEYGIKRMKTKWGTCNREAKRIWLNLELAKKPIQCIEYIVVHEMVHLLERNHNERFIAYMNKFLPQWRHLKEELNRLPVSHVDWRY
jgi:predicted metal-dependent hydrolase